MCLSLQMELEEKESKHYREAKRGNFEGAFPLAFSRMMLQCGTAFDGVRRVLEMDLQVHGSAFVMVLGSHF